MGMRSIVNIAGQSFEGFEGRNVNIIRLALVFMIVGVGLHEMLMQMDGKMSSTKRLK